MSKYDNSNSSSSAKGIIGSDSSPNASTTSSLAPSKSTVYLSNLPFSLTRNDIHKIFEDVGIIVKTTIVKNRERKSTGIAFILFLNIEDANKCIQEFNEKMLFGRTIKCSLAKDNGRTREFIRRKEYPDKSTCYECGDKGHMSYSCPKNLLGDREKRKKRMKNPSTDDFEEETLDFAIKNQLAKEEEDNYRIKVSTGDYNENNTQNDESSSSNSTKRRRRIVKDSYFSDEEVEDNNV